MDYMRNYIGCDEYNMKKIKIVRMNICNERWLLGNPIVEVDIYGKGGYRNIINQLNYAGYDIITLPEYNKKIVKYANKQGITVEEESEYIPTYIKKKFEKRFHDFGPLDLGLVFSHEDARLAEKIVLNIAKYCRFLSIPDYPRCRRVAETILKNNGLQINLENTLEKIFKKCDIILNVKNLELTSGITNIKEEEF